VLVLVFPPVTVKDRGARVRLRPNAGLPASKSCSCSSFPLFPSATLKEIKDDNENEHDRGLRNLLPQVALGRSHPTSD
jgi:hypothetical protein